MSGNKKRTRAAAAPAAEEEAKAAAPEADGAEPSVGDEQAAAAVIQGAAPAEVEETPEQMAARLTAEAKAKAEAANPMIQIKRGDRIRPCRKNDFPYFAAQGYVKL